MLHNFQCYRLHGSWIYLYTKTKSSIPDLFKDDDKTESTNSDKEKANVLADFFTSVFTIEGDGKMPDIEKVDVLPLETMIIIRDRPFNLKGGGLWFFISFRIFFSDNTRVRIIFCCRAKCNFFFQNSTVGYITKTLNQIISPPPPPTHT